MVLCTFCPLIIPFLALSGITSIHPVRAPVSNTVGVVVIRSPDSSGSMQHYADLFHSRWEFTAPVAKPLIERVVPDRTT